MGIPNNNNVDSDADSNISQILLLLDDHDRKTSARKNPPSNKDTSGGVKKKTLNLGSALFGHQKNKNTDFSSLLSPTLTASKSLQTTTNLQTEEQKALQILVRAMKALLMGRREYHQNDARFPSKQQTQEEEEEEEEASLSTE
eukprot:jgi/Psemu1/33326/gm1.33326_g